MLLLPLSSYWEADDATRVSVQRCTRDHFASESRGAFAPRRLGQFSTQFSQAPLRRKTSASPKPHAAPSDAPAAAPRTPKTGTRKYMPMLAAKSASR